MKKPVKPKSTPKDLTRAPKMSTWEAMERFTSITTSIRILQDRVEGMWHQFQTLNNAIVENREGDRKYVDDRFTRHMQLDLETSKHQVEQFTRHEQRLRNLEHDVKHLTNQFQVSKRMALSIFLASAIVLMAQLGSIFLSGRNAGWW